MSWRTDRGAWTSCRQKAGPRLLLFWGGGRESGWERKASVNQNYCRNENFSSTSKNNREERRGGGAHGFGGKTKLERRVWDGTTKATSETNANKSSNVDGEQEPSGKRKHREKNQGKSREKEDSTVLIGGQTTTQQQEKKSKSPGTTCGRKGTRDRKESAVLKRGSTDGSCSGSLQKRRKKANYTQRGVF